MGNLSLADNGEWGGPNSCATRLCECDRALAKCLRHYYCPRKRAICKSNPFRLLQNLVMIFWNISTVEIIAKKRLPQFQLKFLPRNRLNVGIKDILLIFSPKMNKIFIHQFFFSPIFFIFHLFLQIYSFLYLNFILANRSSIHKSFSFFFSYFQIFFFIAVFFISFQLLIMQNNKKFSFDFSLFSSLNLSLFFLSCKKLWKSDEIKKEKSHLLDLTRKGTFLFLITFL